MQVTVHLHGNLKRYAHALAPDARLALPDPATVRDLLDRVGIPEAEWWMVVIDDRVAGEGTPLTEGALVEVMEPVAGGATAPPFVLADLIGQAREEHPDWSEAFCFGLAVPLGFYYHSNDRRSPTRWFRGTRPDASASLRRQSDAAPYVERAHLVRTALRENALAMDLDRTHWEAIMGMELLAEDFETWAGLPDAAACAHAAAQAVVAPPHGGALWRGLYSAFLEEAAASFPPAAALAKLLETLCADWRALADTLDGDEPLDARYAAAGRQIRRLAMREEFFWGRVLDLTE